MIDRHQSRPVEAWTRAPYSQSHSHPAAMPERLEAGTPNLPGIAGLCAALAWHAAEGETFRRQAEWAGKRLRSGLRSIAGVRVVDDEAQVERLPVVSFLVEGWPVEDAGLALEESFGIACRTGLHCAPLTHEALGCAGEGTVRLSVSGFSTEAEVDTVLRSIARLVDSR
ncbi:MAG: aminotransferase class V-fold PLP-dependent enzyme [Acidobacteriaceae bacterium]